MKERPILFSGPMVRAIIEGRKTQTRRIIKDIRCLYPAESERDKNLLVEICKYGKPGDRLWVRETWADLRGQGFDGLTAYRADTPTGSTGDRARIDYGIKWKPSIHMPRWASRTTLEIKNIKVERLNEISEEDAKAEGVEVGEYPIFEGDKYVRDAQSYTLSFYELWDKINGPGAWNQNPWVWAIEFNHLRTVIKA